MAEPRRPRKLPQGSDGAPRRSGRLDETRGVFMISIAAELADMHPQTLRMYEARGLIAPQRSPKNTRLYSHRDVERLRRIQRMTTELGLNLAGVETVLDLEQRVERMKAEMERMRERADRMERELLDEIERVRRSFRAEIVPYGAYQPGGMTPAGEEAVEIPVRRRSSRGDDSSAVG